MRNQDSCCNIFETYPSRTINRRMISEYQTRGLRKKSNGDCWQEGCSSIAERLLCDTKIGCNSLTLCDPSDEYQQIRFGNNGLELFDSELNPMLDGVYNINGGLIWDDRLEIYADTQEKCINSCLFKGSTDIWDGLQGPTYIDGGLENSTWGSTECDIMLVALESFGRGELNMFDEFFDMENDHTQQHNRIGGLLDFGYDTDLTMNIKNIENSIYGSSDIDNKSNPSIWDNVADGLRYSFGFDSGIYGEPLYQANNKGSCGALYNNNGLNLLDNTIDQCIYTSSQVDACESALTTEKSYIARPNGTTIFDHETVDKDIASKYREYNNIGFDLVIARGCQFSSGINRKVDDPHMVHQLEMLSKKDNILESDTWNPLIGSDENIYQDANISGLTKQHMSSIHYEEKKSQKKINNPNDEDSDYVAKASSIRERDKEYRQVKKQKSKRKTESQSDDNKNGIDQNKNDISINTKDKNNKKNILTIRGCKLQGGALDLMQIGDEEWEELRNLSAFRLGDKGRGVLKSRISKHLRDHPDKREPAMAIAGVRCATTKQLFQLAQLCGLNDVLPSMCHIKHLNRITESSNTINIMEKSTDICSNKVNSYQSFIESQNINSNNVLPNITCDPLTQHIDHEKAWPYITRDATEKIINHDIIISKPNEADKNTCDDNTPLSSISTAATPTNVDDVIQNDERPICERRFSTFFTGAAVERRITRSKRIRMNG